MYRLKITIDREESSSYTGNSHVVRFPRGDSTLSDWQFSRDTFLFERRRTLGPGGCRKSPLMSSRKRRLRPSYRNTVARKDTFNVVCVSDWTLRAKVKSKRDPNRSTTEEVANNMMKEQRSEANSNGDSATLVIREVHMKQGDIVKVFYACNVDGTHRRPVPRTFRRLPSGLLDTNYPAHDPEDEKIWWMGRIMYNGRCTQTIRFPQRKVALIGDMRKKTKTFRCKMCSRMQSDFIKNSLLEDFGITGQDDHVFGSKDLCCICGSKILKLLKNVAESILSGTEGSDAALQSVLSSIVRRKLVHENAQDTFNLTEKIPPNTSIGIHRPDGLRPEISSPRTRNFTESRQSVIQPVEATGGYNENSEDNGNNGDPDVLKSSVGQTAEPEKLRPVLVKLYKGATNSGGHMSADDILAFAEQMGKDYPDYSAVSGLKLDAKTTITIVEALDADGNGTIECEEWVDWLLRGMGKTKAQRDAFARGQPKFAKLREFLDAVQVVAEKEAGISTGLVEEGKITYRFVMPNDKEAVKITMKSAKVLQQVPALSALEDGDLEKIVDSMEYKSYNRENPLIVEQGSSADEFFIVIVGKVSIMVADKQGWPREHCKKNVFEWFGEERFLGLENDRYTFSAIATGDQQVWVLKLNCKENKILNDHSEEIVAAARASRNHAAASIFLKQLKE